MRRKRGKTPSPVRRQVLTVLSLTILGFVCIGSSYKLGLVFGENWIILTIGWALVATALIIRVLAATSLGNTQQIDTLTTSGIYKRTRNPIYLAMIFAVIGITLVSGAILAWGWIAISGTALYWIAKREERDLEKAFGEAYLKYKQDVPLFWPRIRR